MHYVEGSRYVGTFDKDQRNGYGMYVFADGERYQGMWKNNQRHGYGSFQYNEGTVFEGNRSHYGDLEIVCWAASRPPANFFSPMLLLLLYSCSFAGTWWQDGRRGEGRLCLANGDVVVGSWQGEQISQATYTKGSLAQATKYLHYASPPPPHSSVVVCHSCRPIALSYFLASPQIFTAAADEHSQDGQEAGPRRTDRLRPEVDRLFP
jgi:hypothetical protein